MYRYELYGQLLILKSSCSLVYRTCCTAQFLLACDLHTDSLMKFFPLFYIAICIVCNAELLLPFSSLVQLQNSV